MPSGWLADSATTASAPNTCYWGCSVTSSAWAWPLGGLGIAPETARRRVEETIGQGPGEPVMGFGLPMTKPATLVLGLAGREAMELDHDRLGTEDLLLALAREDEGVAARILKELGAGLLELREAVAAQYAAGIDPEPFPPDRGPATLGATAVGEPASRDPAGPGAPAASGTSWC